MKIKKIIKVRSYGGVNKIDVDKVLTNIKKRTQAMKQIEKWDNIVSPTITQDEVDLRNITFSNFTPKKKYWFDRNMSFMDCVVLGIAIFAIVELIRI